MFCCFRSRRNNSITLANDLTHLAGDIFRGFSFRNGRANDHTCERNLAQGDEFRKINAAGEENGQVNFFDE